jgi:hypothetical protein
VPTVNPPATHAGTYSTTGFSYVFAEQAIRERLTDRLDVLPLLDLRGDLAGSGSDTIRITNIGSIGFAQRMESLASENSRPTPQAYTLGYDSVTLGIKGLSHSATFLQTILARERAAGGGLSLEQLKAMVPESFLATLRYDTCVAGAAISGSVGSASYNASVDDALSFLAYTSRSLGASGTPALMLDPEQQIHLQQSFRVEPAFQSSMADFAAAQAAAPGMQVKRNYMGLGFDVFLSDDVQQSGGAYQGFGFMPGAIGWAKASVSPVQGLSDPNAMYFDEFGLLVFRLADGEGNMTQQYAAMAFYGVALGSADVFPQTRFISKV